MHQAGSPARREAVSWVLQAAAVPKRCQCVAKLGESGCGGAEFFPTTRTQKYQPDCARKIQDGRYGAGWYDRQQARNAERRTPSHIVNRMPPMHRQKATEGRTPNVHCKSCYGLGHHRLDELAGGQLGCKRCGELYSEEKLEPEPPCFVSSSAGWAITNDR